MAESAAGKELEVNQYDRNDPKFREKLDETLRNPPAARRKPEFSFLDPIRSLGWKHGAMLIVGAAGVTLAFVGVRSRMRALLS